MQADTDIRQKVIVIEESMLALEMNLDSKQTEGTFAFWSLPDEVDQRGVASTLVFAASVLLPELLREQLVRIFSAIQDDITNHPDYYSPPENKDLTDYPF